MLSSHLGKETSTASIPSSMIAIHRRIKPSKYTISSVKKRKGFSDCDPFRWNPIDSMAVDALLAAVGSIYQIIPH